MSDAAIFVAVFGGIFILRIIAATAVFCWLLPANDRCLHCDASTLWIRKPVWNRLLPWLRTSWCPECRWEGMLRHAPRPPRAARSPSLGSQKPGSPKPGSRKPA